MVFNFWMKGREKDVSDYTEVEIAELVLKVDEEFMSVLQQKIDGVATQYDECYLDNKIRNDKYCRMFYKIKKARHPDLKVRCKKRTRKQLLVGIISILIIGGASYAILRKSEHPVVPKPIVPFNQSPVREVIDSAYAIYGKRIILDEAEIGNIRSSGAIDPARPLEDFLRKFTAVTRLEFYSDSVRVIHIKKAPAASTIQK